MANKRIELEQYRCYVNLFDEEPNRKKVKAGVVIAMVSATLLVVLIFVLGLLSGNLVTNPRNVLEKPAPPASSPEEAVPGMNIPGQEGGLPTDISIPPGQEGGLPTDISIPPGRRAASRQISAYPSSRTGRCLPAPRRREVRYLSGPPAVSLPITGLLPSLRPAPMTVRCSRRLSPQRRRRRKVRSRSPYRWTRRLLRVHLEPAAPASTAPADEKTDGEKQEDAGPSTETKGVGNLSNLAEQVSGRGFQIYMLLLTIALGVVIYLTLKRASREGKAR